MLSAAKISKIQGGESLFSNGTFQINPGEKVGLVGPNGVGKSTLFRMIIDEESYEGQISKSDRFRISYFSQNVGEMKANTALQEVSHADESIFQMKEKLREFEEKLCLPDLSEEEMNKTLEQMGDVQSEFEKVGGYDLENRAEEILTGLGIPPSLHHQKMEKFSGGKKMRIALAKTLVTNPDLILMDEPTNYLDIETILWLEEWLKNFKGSIFMTTHDRDFMKNVCKKIIEIDNQTITTYSGDYDFYLGEKKIRREQLRAEYNRQKEMLSKEEQFIERFKARASHAAQVQSRAKKIEKIQRVELPSEEEVMTFQFPEPPRGPDEVVIIKNLTKTWKGQNGIDTNVFSDLNTTIFKGEKIALVGVNGAGKSTLINTICGRTPPTSGTVKIGSSVKLGYFGQFTMDVLNLENTLFDEVRSGLPEASDGYIRNLLAAFLFKGDDVFKKIKFLSGGEKSRLILAIIFSQSNNLLILDEPTNHLDIKSRVVLLNYLKEYNGTILFVSHDRHFLHAIAEKVMEVDRGGINIYPGSYQYYLDKKRSKN